MDKDKYIIEVKDRKHWFPDMYMLNDIRKDKILKMLKIDGKELLEDEGFNEILVGLGLKRNNYEV